MINIRCFRPEDAHPVSALIQDTMRRCNSRDYTPDRLQLLIAYFTPGKVAALAAERYCLVAEESNAIIGTAALDGAEIVTFFVRLERQGKGIGSELLLALERHAAAVGLQTLHVDSSVTALGFYERQGYRRTGRVLDGSAGPQIRLVKEFGSDLEHDLGK